VINGVESSRFSIKTGLPQGSPLSPILFLLYNKELLCIANRPNLGVHSIRCDGSTKGVSQRRHLLNAHQLRILNWREEEEKTNYSVRGLVFIASDALASVSRLDGDILEHVSST
jgi:hypothetical protein